MCRKIHVLIRILCLSLCSLSCHHEAVTPPLLSSCAIPEVSPDVKLGIGRDGFLDQSTHTPALMVGGYQGGYHLWGAIELPGNLTPSEIRGIHIFACDTSTVVAEAVYSSSASVDQHHRTISAIPIVFKRNEDVDRLDGEYIQLFAAIADEQSVHFASHSVLLECCGHVADGD